MQTASAEFAAAVTSAERRLAHRLQVDWDNSGVFTGAEDNQTARVEQITVDRSLTTDLPDEVTLLAGQTSAEMTATLSGDRLDQTLDGARYYSPYNSASPLFRKRRRWRRVQADLGLRTPATELLTAFTGRSRGVTVDAASRTATLTALDNAELMRGDVQIPFFAANDAPVLRQPGLDGTWLIDHVARRAGFFATPPPRANPRVVATLAGSAYPEVGGVSRLTEDSTTGRPLRFTTGKFLTGLVFNASFAHDVLYIPTSSLTTNDGADFVVDGWVFINNLSTAQGLFSLVNNTATDPPVVDVFVTTAGVLQMSLRRAAGGALSVLNSGRTVPTGSFVYIGVHIHMTSTTITIHWRVDGVVTTTTHSTSTVTGAPGMNRFRLGFARTSATATDKLSGAMEAWQVAVTSTGTAAPPWNDAFVPSARIARSKNTLAAVPVQRKTAWETVKQIAAAELGTVGFAEDGTFEFWNRDRWTTAPYTTSQRTITEDTALMALSVEENIDQVRNKVRVVASTATVMPPAYVWSAPQVFRIPASGSTVVWANLDKPAVDVSVVWRYQPAGGTGQSAYRGNTREDGGGATVSNLTFATTVFPQSVRVTVSNPNAFDVFLVNPSGVPSAQGSPAMSIWATPVLFDNAPQLDSSTTNQSGVVQEVSDSASISAHGEQLFELSGNPYLQDFSSIETLAADLLAQLKAPKAVLRGITIPADPRLQLGDRVTVQAPTLGLTGDFHLVGIRTSYSPQGATQSLDVRAA